MGGTWHGNLKSEVSPQGSRTTKGAKALTRLAVVDLLRLMAGWWYTYPPENMSSADWIMIPCIGEKNMFQTNQVGFRNQRIRCGDNPN